MTNTYTQIHLHVVFAVKKRQSLISPSWKNKLYAYITGIIQKNGHKLLIINGMRDHVHILIGMRPNQSLSNLIQDIKGSSSKWINQEKLTEGKFEWQEGYGAFSYYKSDVKQVLAYIQNQELHHAQINFTDEYLNLLMDLDIPFDKRYVFKAIE